MNTSRIEEIRSKLQRVEIAINELNSAVSLASSCGITFNTTVTEVVNNCSGVRFQAINMEVGVCKGTFMSITREDGN